MAAQVDALAQCPPETFRPSTPTVHGAGLVRRATSLPFLDTGIHPWVHPAPKRPAEATHAPVPRHRGTPEAAPGPAAPSTHWTTSPATAAAAAAEMTMSEPASHKLSADVPSKSAPRSFAPQDRTPDGRSLQLTSPTRQDVDVKPPPLQKGTSLKRRREISDVDGTDTGSRGRKKRRLRRFLITSRLSQPFSLPASHILNRESLATGDKRFLKLAAIVNARRIVPLLAPSASASAAASPHLPGHPSSLPVPVHHPTSTSTLLHRAAVANRLRKRLYKEVAATGRPIETKGLPAQLMASARFSAVPASGAGTAARAAAVHPAAAGATGLHPPRVPAGFRPAAARTGLAVGLVPAPIAMRISPRLRPVADLTPVPSLCLYKGKEVDDSHSAHDIHHNIHHNVQHDDDSDDESERYDYGASDDPEDVYADFSVLFGGGSDDEWDEEGIDDIMDELDGIAHLPKQSVS